MKGFRAVVSTKEELSNAVMKLASESKSFDELDLKLRSKGIVSYYRKNALTGVWYGNRKFRLSNLGVGKAHLKELSKEQKRLDGLRQIQKDNYNDREVER